VHKHCYQQLTTGYAFSARKREENPEPSNTTEAESSYARGNFKEVIQFVKDEVIGLGRAVSMKYIHTIYKLGDCRYRQKLKLRLKNYFKDDISFLTPETKSVTLLFRTPVWILVLSIITE